MMKLFKTPYLVLFFLILFYCLDYFFRISVGLVFHPLLHQYATTALGIGAFVSLFYWGYAILQIPGGLLLDKCDFKWLVAIMVAGSSVFFAVFAYVDHYWLGLLSRFMIGALSSISFTCVLYFSRNYLSQKWFGLVVGITISCGTFVASLFQLFVSTLLHDVGWHAVYYSIAVIGVLIGATIFLLVYLFSPKLDRSVPVLIPYVSGIRQIIADKTILFVALTGGLFYLPTTLFAAIWGVPFLQHDYHLSLTDASFGVTMLFAGWAVGSPIVGWLMDRLRHYLLLMLVFAVLAGVASLLILNHWRGISVLLFLMGLFSSAQVIVWKVFRDVCPKALSGFAVAYINMLIMLFGAVFHLLAGYLAEHHHLPSQTNVINYAAGLSMMPIAFALVVVCSAVLIRMQRNSENSL